MSQDSTTRLPERDPAKPNTEQGLYRKYEVQRTDGNDQPGGKHYDCEYFVLDVTHDPHAKAALAAYAASVGATHPQLADDMRERYALARSEAQGEWDAAMNDALLYGNGYLVDGKRVPPESVQIATPPADRAPCQNCGSLIALGAHDAKGACGAPADRAPGEVGEVLAAMREVLVEGHGVSDKLLAEWIEALAARAPSAQGEDESSIPVAKVVRKGNHTGTLTWTDHGLLSSLPDETYLYTSAPAAGDGDAKAAKLTAGLQAAFAAMQSSYHDDRRIMFHEIGAVVDLANELRFKLSPPPALAHPTAGEQQGEGRADNGDPETIVPAPSSRKRRPTP